MCEKTEKHADPLFKSLFKCRMKNLKDCNHAKKKTRDFAKDFQNCVEKYFYESISISHQQNAHVLSHTGGDFSK